MKTALIALMSLMSVSQALAQDQMVTQMHCWNIEEIRDYGIDVKIQTALNSNLMIATVQESTIAGRFAPKSFDLYSRRENSQWITYQGEGFKLRINKLHTLPSRRPLPPMNQAILKAKGLMGSDTVSLVCRLPRIAPMGR